MDKRELGLAIYKYMEQKADGRIYGIGDFVIDNGVLTYQGKPLDTISESDLQRFASQVGIVEQHDRIWDTLSLADDPFADVKGDPLYRELAPNDDIISEDIRNSQEYKELSIVEPGADEGGEL